MITRISTYSQIKGVSVSNPCLVATVGSITLSGTQTIDGIFVNNGDRVLVKNQSPASANGIYVVSEGAWSRAVDMSIDEDVFQGLQTYINSGTTTGFLKMGSLIEIKYDFFVENVLMVDVQRPVL